MTMRRRRITVTSVVQYACAARAQARAGHLGRALVGGLRRGDDHGALASDGATASCVVLGRFSPLESFGPWCGFPGPGCLLLGGTPPFSWFFRVSPHPCAQCLCFLVSLSLRPRLGLISRSILHHHSPRITHHTCLDPSFGVPVPVLVPGLPHRLKVQVL